MSNPLITINLVVLNGEKYIRHCLDGILAQTYPNELIEINILDNGSLDNTVGIIENLKFKKQNIKFLKWDLIKSDKNLGMWPGQEELLKYSNGKYVLAMAVDVVLDKDFVKNAVEIMEKDDRIGALQAKIYKFELSEVEPRGEVQPQETSEVGPRYEDRPRGKILDTCGFKIERSRRVTNIGHGEEDKGQYDSFDQIFGVEGAAPFFRREALEDCRISNPLTDSTISPQVSSGSPGFERPSEIVDHDFFWYGDDLDLAWRMTLFGWKQVFAPSVIAWHDRQTTKNLKKHWWDYLSRVSARQQIPIRKRRWDWRNTRFTIIKNDYIINILKDLPYVVTRETMILGYTILFESRVLLEIPNFLRLLPSMLKKRGEIMKKARINAEDIHKWFK